MLKSHDAVIRLCHKQSALRELAPLQCATCPVRYIVAILQRIPLVQRDSSHFQSANHIYFFSIMALNMGGDDFIAKPFDLNVRIELHTELHNSQIRTA